MMKNKIKFVLIATLCSLSLACNLAQYVLLGMAGVQGQVDSLTQVAVPLETDTPTTTAPISPTRTDTPLPKNTPPVQTSPADENTEAMLGKWAGTAQWLCDNNAVWWLSMDFTRAGNVRIALSGPSDPIVNNFPWFLDGNNIKVQTEYGDWTGTITGNSINGTFSEENCNGVWSVTKQ